MNIVKFIKHIFLFLLTFLLGAQTTYAKTELVLPQNQVSFPIEQSQSFIPKAFGIEKEVPPNIGFLKEKSKFGMSESISAQNTYNFSGVDVSNLAEAGGDILTQRKSFWDEWINKCFPGENWANTTFETLGKDYNTFKNSSSLIDNEMRAMYNSASDADNYLPGVVNSGSTNPVSVTANQGEKFYKIVPKGGNINSTSPYYLSEADYNWIKANPSQLEQKLGLPLSSVSDEYDVFTITSKVNNNKLFQSTVAPTKQFSNSTPNIIYNTTGGRTQSLIINNSKTNLWEKSVAPIETITPNSLPQIGN